MKSQWIALGIVGMIPLLAVAQAPDRTYQLTTRPSTSHSVIKPAGFGVLSHRGCSSCAEPAPTCCTPMPPPPVGNCCPKPCLLEKVRRGLRSLDCLLPCRLGCHTSCSTHCKPTCTSCTASCEVNSACPSCCTKSRAHFFAFCKPKCSKPCCSSCCAPVPSCCSSIPSSGIPGPLDIGPPPVPEGNPFQDDKPEAPVPPPGRETYYKPYWKKNPTTAAPAPLPTPDSVPVKLDPYAVAPPVHIKARPIQPAAKVAIRATEPVQEAPVVKVASAEEIEPFSITISDEPPAPPMMLPAPTTAKRIDLDIPVNPLR
jgi:hypothetical protein